MLLLVPLGAEERPRAPRATLALVAVNVLVFLWTGRHDAARAAAEEAEITRVAEWTLRLAEEAVPGIGQRARGHGSVLAFLDRDARWRDEIPSAELRERLEGCLADYRRIRASHPFYRHGFVPAEVSIRRLLSHQFLHADLLHLGFNMLFLWSVGGLLELTFGGAPFSAAYLASGFAAALAHGAFHPQSAEPAIGASGAVAGLMGWLAVSHARQPVRLAVVAMLAAAPRIFIVTWPAYVFLGLWLLEQLFYASFDAPLGIAFWAHIGGFAFGMLLGLAVRAWRGGPLAGDSASD
jgi:membrane associated rhomboid family serine protease